MSSPALFGQNGLNAQAVAPSSGDFVKQPKPAGEACAPVAAKKSRFRLPGAVEDDMPDIRLKQAYGEDSSFFVIIMLWLFLGGIGAHRYYMGHKLLGTAIVVLGMAGGMLLFSSIATILDSYHKTGQLAYGGLVSYAILSIIHIAWVLFDGIYILIRKLISR